MEQSEILRIKNQKSNPKERNRNRHLSKKSKSVAQENDTEIPDSMMPAPGVSMTQSIQGIQNLQGLSNNNDLIQNELQNIQPQNNIQNPQQMFQYGNPILMNNYQQGIPITNQINPIQVEPLVFGLVPKQIICPYCHTIGLTRIEESFNLLACCCCTCKAIFIPIAFCCIGACAGGPIECGGSGKDCCECNCWLCKECRRKCCHDVNHYCPNCGKMIGTWDSLKDTCRCLDNCCFC